MAAAPWHYDPLGRLSGASTSPGTPPAIAYESYVDNLVAERTPGSSTVQRRHVFGPGVDEPLVWYEGSSRRFLQADERGSIVAVTSDTGAPLAINRYDEYGQTESTSNAHMGRFLYTGQRYFGGFGLYHYKNRVYDPRVGRFMQPDPIGYQAGMNLYAYVGGDPINWTDPLGLEAKESEEEEVDIFVDGPHPRGGGGAGAAALLGAGRTHGASGAWDGGMGDRPNDPHAAVCGNADCSDIIVTAPTTKTRFRFNGRAWVWNPHYIRSPYSTQFDYATAFMFAGPILIIAGVEGAAALPITTHGMTRIAGANATRGGVLSVSEALASRAMAAKTYLAANGARVYVQSIGHGRYNVSLWGERGFISGYRHVSSNTIIRLSRSGGWQ